MQRKMHRYHLAMLTVAMILVALSSANASVPRVVLGELYTASW